jgi:hypothetical protein
MKIELVTTSGDTVICSNGSSKQKSSSIDEAYKIAYILYSSVPFSTLDEFSESLAIRLGINSNDVKIVICEMGEEFQLFKKEVMSQPYVMTEEEWKEVLSREEEPVEFDYD